jgi:hypothetical protein
MRLRPPRHAGTVPGVRSNAIGFYSAFVNTSGLAGPMISMQEALAEFQAVDVEVNRIKGLVDRTN